MNIFIFIGFYIVSVMTPFFSDGSSAPSSFSYQRKESAEEVLKKVSTQLTGLKTLKYKSHLELNYASEGYHYELPADGYLDFNSGSNRLGFKYQFSNQDLLTVFNGSERFDCGKKSRIITIDNKPTAEFFGSNSFLFNSPVTLRNNLPAIISDPSTPKTMIEPDQNTRDVYVIEFVLDKKVLNRLGGYLPMSLDRKTIYRLTIDKANYLPVEILQTNSANQDYMKTSFSDIEINPNDPGELSWYYSTYLKDYQIKEKGEKKTLIATGQAAPDWRLTDVDTGETVSLSQFKNKVVLLEFWITHCGYCIAAVPKLNMLFDKYKDKDFKLLAINVEDEPDAIKLFQKNNKPLYEILSASDALIKDYGVDRFPTVLLIDKKGNVIYSGNLDQERLEELINGSIR